jgi:hypothetical protein
VIAPDDALQVLAWRCPSFTSEAQQRRVDDGTDEWSRFARHLVDLAQSGEDGELPAVMGALEQLLSEGDDATVSFVRTGIIEEIQNITSHRDVPVEPSRFRELLGPEAAEVWDEFDESWLAAAAHRGMQVQLPSAEDYLHLEGDQRRKMQAMTRELPDGTLARPSDVLRYEAVRYDDQLERRATWRRRLPLVWLTIGLAVLVICIIAVS